MSGEFRPPFLGAIDQGTQSSRFLVFDSKGDLVSSCQKKHTQYTPQPGWYEHDPEEIVSVVRECIDESVKQFQEKGLDIADIKAVGVTNQRETTIVWDRKTGKPLHNALVWLDTRTSGICDGLSDQHGGPDAFRRLCGLPISTYFSGVKLKWLLENVPEIKEKADQGEAAFGTIDSWLIHSLSGGVHVTDVSNAARTMLMSLKTCDWDEEICGKLGIPMSMLPPIKSSAEKYGTLSGTLLDGVPIASCLGDQSAAILGHCALSKGESKITYGTGCFTLLNTGQEPVYSQNGLLTTVGFQLGPDAKPAYFLEGSVAIAGVGISWLVDNMKMLEDASESEKIASSVEDTGGVYLVPAFSGLFAPHWRGDARGIIMGLTQFTKSAHIVRAMLEAVAFQVVDVVQAMKRDSGIQIDKMRVDGGMTANGLLMQTQCDLLGCEVQRPEMPEATALGCALAAGLAVGVWKNEDELVAMHKEHVTYEEFKAQSSDEERQRRHDRWLDALQRTLNWEK